MLKHTSDTIEVYLTEEQIATRIHEIAADITARFQGEEVTLVGILKGSVFFLTDLAKRIDLPLEIEFMSVSSYGAMTKSSGVVNIKMDLGSDISGKNVIIVEDIIDTGNTLQRLLELFRSRNPKTLTLCTLLDKPDRRTVKGIQVDYTGFVVPDKFVVGYGLDYNQKYRDLPYIGFVQMEE